MKKIMYVLMSALIIQSAPSVGRQLFSAEGDALESPSKIVAEIEAFLETKRSEEAVHNDGSDDAYIRLTEYSHEVKSLLHSAYIASHLCQVTIDSNEALVKSLEDMSGGLSDEANAIHRLIRAYQGDCYADGASCYQEFNVLFADCLCNCTVYKPQLNEKILLLQQEYIKARYELNKSR